MENAWITKILLYDKCYIFIKLVIQNISKAPLKALIIKLFSIMLQANKLHVQGGGSVHAQIVNLYARQLIVDDLGQIKGDVVSSACTVGNAGSAGAG